MEKEPQQTRIKGKTLQDFFLLSPLLQDALCPHASMQHEKGVFSFLSNRFLWEHYHHHNELMRVHSGVVFKNVLRVRSRGKSSTDVHNLLMVKATEVDGEKKVVLLFSDSHEIELTLKEWNYTLADFQEPWQTQVIPSHARAA